MVGSVLDVADPGAVFGERNHPVMRMEIASGPNEVAYVENRRLAEEVGGRAPCTNAHGLVHSSAGGAA